MPYTTKEAAVELGLTPAAVRKMIERGQLVAQKSGHDYLVTHEAVEAARTRRKPGRPSLAEMHDSDLAALAREGDPEAQAEDARRTRAAAIIRDTLARVYARGDTATFSQWGVVPCRTADDTIGILDVTHGTAWDTGVPCPEDVDSLGYIDAPDTGANNPGSTAVVTAAWADGRTEQIQPASRLPLMPEGWRQIGLPTWRGHEGTSPYRPSPVPPRKEWIRPCLVAFGLRTCYGERGTPRRTLADTAGWHVRREYESGRVEESRWPQGVPEWITAGFEALDPSWWPVTPEQDGALRCIADTWIMQHVLRLADLTSDAQAIREALQPAERDLHALALTIPADEDYGMDGQMAAMPPPNYDRRIDWSALFRLAPEYPEQQERKSWVDDAPGADAQMVRGHAAHTAATGVLRDVGAYGIWQSRLRPGEVIGMRYVDVLTGLLCRLIYERLQPVYDAMAWMHSHEHSLMRKGQFQDTLTVVARHIGEVLCEGMSASSRALLNRMVRVYYGEEEA